MTRTRQIIGRWGETVAVDYLQRLGYDLLERNTRTPYGELDLIVLRSLPDGVRELVFVEVKARRSPSLGPPEISVTPRKRAHLLASVDFYLQAHPDLADLYRVDVIAISLHPGWTEPEIVHFENAFSGC